MIYCICKNEFIKNPALRVLNLFIANELTCHKKPILVAKIAAITNAREVFSNKYLFFDRSSYPKNILAILMYITIDSMLIMSNIISAI